LCPQMVIIALQFLHFRHANSPLPLINKLAQNGTDLRY
jgi:hypothetical protein